MLKFNFMGDVMLGELLENYRRGLRTILEKRGIDPFEHVLPILAEADLNVINLECVFSDSSILDKPFSGILISPESFIRFLSENGINVVNTANNHALDHGRGAFERSLKIIREKGIEVIGYTENCFFQEEPVVVEIERKRLGLFGYNISNFPEQDRKRTVDRIKDVIKDSRRSLDTIIVSMHWGEEYTNVPPAYVVESGRELLESGCDILHGHHSHHVQGVIKDGNRVFAPSLGNFIFDQMVDRNRITAILRVEIDDAGDLDFRCLPCYMNDCYQPVAAPEYAEYLGEITVFLEKCWKEDRAETFRELVENSVKKGHQNNRIRMRVRMLAHFWDYLPYVGGMLALRRSKESIYSVIKSEESLKSISKRDGPD